MRDPTITVPAAVLALSLSACADPPDARIERDLARRHADCRYEEAKRGKVSNGRMTVAVLYTCPGDVQPRSDLYRYERRGDEWELIHPAK